MYAIIDIAEAWPGEAKAYPRTLLSYSSTGGQVLGLCSTREEAEEVLADAHDADKNFHIPSLLVVTP